VESDNKEEVMVLGHEPWPGFRKIFLVIFLVSIIYLAIIIYFSSSNLQAPEENHVFRIIDSINDVLEIYL